MSNKGIIIDGVNVSKCEYYMYKYCNACKDNIDGETETTCKENYDCYYKQLKRKEQECEQWAKMVDETHKKFVKVNTELRHSLVENVDLKAENEKLKKVINKINESADKTCKKCSLEDVTSVYCKGCGLINVLSIIKQAKEGE